MPVLPKGHSSHLAEVISVRSREIGMRLALIASSGLCFVALIGWKLTLIWFVISVAVQIVTKALHEWIDRSSMAATPSMLLTTGVLAFSHAVTVSVVVIAALRGGLWGLIDGQIILLAVAVYAITTSRRSKAAFLAPLIPYAVYICILAVIAVRSGGSLAGPLGFVGATSIFLGSFVLVHRSSIQSVQAIDEARARAEVATVAKSSFVAIVSHELRTPISGILAGAAELERSSADRASRRNAALIAESGRMMRTLLNDLLDMSKIEAGRMQVEDIRFDLRELIQGTVRFWAPEVRKAQLRFRLRGARRLPQWVHGDPTRIRQILNNLFSNALKFTETGTVGLHITVRDLTNDGFKLGLEVVDTGPGMNEAQMGRLFGAFDQLHSSTSRTHGGTGLGLHISRQLAQLMGGELGAESAPGTGTTFRLSITMRLAEAPEEVEPAESRDRDGERALHVLIVDDHPVNRQAYTLVLQPVSSHVLAVESGEQAIEALASRPFDVVLMDLNMSGIGGLEATRRLRAGAAGPNGQTVIIAMTASASLKEVDTCLAAGMDAFVMKPVEARELFAAIDQALNARCGIDDTAPQSVRG